MEISQARALYERVFSGVDGFGLSYGWQKGIGERDRNLTYGEIDFDGFLNILCDIPKIDQRKVFYDLGSGVGKAVMAAALLGNFRKAVGIEILSPLHFQTATISRALKEDKYFQNNKNNLPEISFLQKDFLKHDYQEADLVFINSTCFSQELMYALSESLQTIPSGGIVLTVSQSLPSMDVFKIKKYAFSWGGGTVFFHLKS